LAVLARSDSADRVAISTLLSVPLRRLASPHGRITPTTPIVILTPIDFQEDEMAAISTLDNLTIVKGVPTSIANLLAAGIRNARIAVIVAPGPESDAAVEHKDDFLLDSDSIMAYMTISELNSRIELYIEICRLR
jgi:hypothetical protein